MICKAKYEKKEDIPEGLEGEFEKKGDVYVLKESAIEDGDSVFAAGAVANKERALKQLTTKKEELTAANDKAKDLQSQLDAVKDSDSEVLSKEDAKIFKEIKSLGDLKSIPAMVKEFPELKRKVSNDEKTDGLSKFSAATGLNLEVLKDWAFDESKGSGIEFYTKDDVVKVNNVDTKVTKPMIRLSQKEKESGSIKVTEHELMDVAKQRLSFYQVEALTKPSSSSDDKSGDKSTSDKPSAYIPNLSSTGNTTGESKDAKKPVERFNAERSQKPSAFDAPVAAATTT